MPSCKNLSAYRFTPLDALPALRERVLGAAAAGGLKGTVLLSPEGKNLFVAGTPAGTAAFVALLRAVPGLEDLNPKESEGFQQVFQLDGGILKYFEQCGGAHFDGECFVFDERATVNAGLRETRRDALPDDARGEGAASPTG